MTVRKHQVDIDPAAGTDEFIVHCTDCSYEYAATSEVFAQSIKDRHILEAAAREATTG